jgi:SAM-dependent methyltransferase
MSILGRVRRLVAYGLGESGRARKREDKRRAKWQRFSSDSWQKSGAFARRRYAGYDEYRSHQASKLVRVVDRLRETDDAQFEEFRQRFSSCRALAARGNVLCLGARLGAEVRALQSIGHFAVGVDLEPGPGNPYVLHGDFHALVFPNASVDAVYTNALDHVYDLARVVAEVRRVLRPEGCFIADIEEGSRTGRAPGAFKALFWEDADALIERVAEIGDFAVEETSTMVCSKSGPNRLIVFRKRAGASDAPGASPT